METAFVLGVGPGLGTSLAKRFARAGMRVAVASRDASRLDRMLPDLRTAGAAEARAYACDVSSPPFVGEAFRNVSEDLGPPRLVVFNAGTFVPGGLLETDPEAFEQSWRVGCLGGFLVGREAVRAMKGAGPRDDGTLGTIIFTGATASTRGSARFHSLAVAKFGLRALAQSMAREFAPDGVHVAHVIIDGQIDGAREQGSEDKRLDPDAIAENYWRLHEQDRSTWTHELDLRPWVERF